MRFYVFVQESIEKDRKLNEMKNKHNEDILKLEVELNTTIGELKDTQQKFVFYFISN